MGRRRRWRVALAAPQRQQRAQVSACVNKLALIAVWHIHTPEPELWRRAVQYLRENGGPVCGFKWVHLLNAAPSLLVKLVTQANLHTINEATEEARVPA